MDLAESVTDPCFVMGTVCRGPWGASFELLSFADSAASVPFTRSCRVTAGVPGGDGGWIGYQW